MTNKPVYLNQGAVGDDTQIRTGASAYPQAVYTQSPDAESLGELTRRVYGINTKLFRDMLRRANSSFNGTVRVPTS